MDSDPFKDANDFWRGIEKHHDKMDSEFHKLCVEPSTKVPVVGDRVLVAAGLLGMGHAWVRLEATVVECGDTSFKVQFTDTYESRKPMWIHQALITDVLAIAKA